MSSDQASCFFARSSNNRSAALCTATTTDGQLEQPASGQEKGQRAASAAAVALPLSDKPLLVLRPHYGDKVNRRFMGSSWTTTSMYRKRDFCSPDSCYESLDRGCYSGLLRIFVVAFFWKSNMQRRFLLNRINK